MKQLTHLGIILLVICGASFSNGCKKSTTPGAPDTLIQVMYPVTRSYYEGGNSAYPTVYTYEYDANKLLTKYGKDNNFVVNVNAHQVSQTAYTTLSISGFNYTYSLANQNNASVSIYDGSPTAVGIEFFYKDVSTGVVNTSTQNPYYWENNSSGLLQKELISDGGGRNVNYTYDDKKNLKMIEWVALTGTRIGVYSRLKVTAVDNKFSPFAAVKGYRIASYPQAYPPDYAFAYCLNNPTQITVESYDANKNAFVPYEQDDFTYTYNDNGFPTKVVVNVTYYTAVTTHYLKTYEFTYK